MPIRAKYKLWEPFGYPNAALLGAIEAHVSALALPRGARVLDFGCGSQPYRDVLGPDVEYIGADLPDNDLAAVQIVDGVVDLPDSSVDLVISTQVLEHVPDPQAYLAECRRVLRTGGRLLLTTHGVMFYHPHPADFWRWTAEGLERLVADARLTVRSITPLVGAVPLGLWLVMINLQAKLPPGLRHVFVALLNLIIWWSDHGEWDAYRADFDYVVIAERDGSLYERPPIAGVVSAPTASASVA